MIDLAGLITVVSVAIAALTMFMPTVRKRKSMLPPGIIFWAVGCSLQAPIVYTWLDPFLGGRNVTNLLYRSAVIVALGCLEIMVLRAMRDEVGRLEVAVWFGVGAAITFQTFLFMTSSWPLTDPYLGHWVGQPTRELFADILPVCVGLFGVQVSRVAWKGLPGYREWTTRWGLTLIGTAAVVDIFWVGESLVVSIIRATRNPQFWMSGTVDPLWEVAVVTMAAVTAMGIVVAAARPVLLLAWMRLLLALSLGPSNRLLQKRPELSVSSPRERVLALVRRHPDLFLWQRWVELQDGIRVAGFQPKWHERWLIRGMGAAVHADVADNLIPSLGLPESALPLTRIES